MTLKLTLAAAAALLAAQSAVAGGYVAPVPEPVIVAPVVAPVASWAGGYVGGTIGYAFGSDDVVGLETYDAGSFFNKQNDLGSVDVKGLNAGLHAGYRWQRNNWVFGPELWLEGGNIEASDQISYSHSRTIDGTTTEIELDDEMTSSVNYIVGLQFKTGYIVNPQTLVYGTAGVAHGDFDYKFGPMTESYSNTGYSLGLGVERKLRGNLSVFAEWQYRNFGKTEVTYDFGDGDSAITQATPEHHNIKLGVNYQF